MQQQQPVRRHSDTAVRPVGSSASGNSPKFVEAFDDEFSLWPTSGALSRPPTSAQQSLQQSSVNQHQLELSQQQSSLSQEQSSLSQQQSSLSHQQLELDETDPQVIYIKEKLLEKLLEVRRTDLVIMRGIIEDKVTELRKADMETMRIKIAEEVAKLRKRDMEAMTEVDINQERSGRQSTA